MSYSFFRYNATNIKGRYVWLKTMSFAFTFSCILLLIAAIADKGEGMQPDKVYEKPFQTVDGLIVINDTILLIKRKNPPYGWALPGGFLDKGETLEQAFVREIKEETSLGVKNVEQFHTYSDPVRDPRDWIISTVFVAEPVGALEAGDDAEEAEYWPLEELPDMIPFDHRAIIEDFKGSLGI